MLNQGSTMQGFATFILRGRIHAIFVTAVAAVLSMILPPLSHVSGAAVALVTLRNGAFEGALIAAGAALMLLLLGLLSSMDVALVQVFVLSLLAAAWVPVLLCAAILRSLRSLGLALTAAGMLALLAMLVFYLLVGDVRGWWYTVLEALFEPMWVAAPVPLSAGEIEAWLKNLAAIMTGLVAAMLVYSVMINLCLARWWQALLFNPGGFRSEFHGLRLDWRIGVGALPIVLLSSLTSGGLQGFAQDAILLIMAMFSLTGLALVHAVVAARSMHRGSLAGVYILMLFILPQMVMVLAAVGLTDSWLDFRRRLNIRQG